MTNRQAHAAAMPSSTELPLDRAFAVLAAAAGASSPVSVTQLARTCGLPVPTAHRLVAQLESRGMLRRVPGTRKVVIGFAMVRLGVAAIRAAVSADAAHQVLLSFAERIGEHCQVGVSAENEVLYLDTAKAPRSEGLHFEPGRRSPLHCTSIGKLFLAELSDASLDAWLAHAALRPVGPRTILDPAALRRVVRRVRKEGWASSNEEVAAGVVGCAVPVRDAGGTLLAGLGISAPSARVAFDQLPRFRRDMEAAAAEIAAAISQTSGSV